MYTLPSFSDQLVGDGIKFYVRKKLWDPTTPPSVLLRKRVNARDFLDGSLAGERWK